MAEFIIPLANSDKGINLTPKFVHWSCPHCDSTWKKKHCLSDGKYCAMNHDQTGQKYVQLGKDIVMENLRMFCVFKS